MKNFMLILSWFTLSLCCFGQNDTISTKAEFTSVWELSNQPEGFQPALFALPDYFQFDSAGTYLALKAFKNCDSNKVKVLKKRYGNVYKLNGDTTKENVYLVNTSYNRNLRPIWCGFLPKWRYNTVSKELKINTVMWFSTKQKVNAPVYSNPIMMVAPEQQDCYVSVVSLKLILLTATEMIIERKLSKQKTMLYHYKKSPGQLHLPKPIMIKAKFIPSLVQPTTIK